MMRRESGGAAVARQSHKLKVVGSTPSPAIDIEQRAWHRVKII
jgi:hypothetical protein